MNSNMLKILLKNIYLTSREKGKVGVLFARLPSMLVNMCTKNMLIEILEQILHRFASLVDFLIGNIST